MDKSTAIISAILFFILLVLWLKNRKTTPLPTDPCGIGAELGKIAQRAEEAKKRADARAYKKAQIEFERTEKALKKALRNQTQTPR